MKKIKLILVSIILLIIVSCESLKPISGKLEFYKIPEINVVSEQEIGETIFTDKYEEVNKSIFLNNEINITWNLTKFQLEKGYYPLTDENDLYYFYSVNSIEKGFYKKGFAENKKTGEIKLFIDSGLNLLFKDHKEINYTKKDYINYDKCNSCFRKEFIFNGKSDNNLKFIYREFSDNMLRPAFTQELQYDLKDGNIVGFKGLRIEVISANNTSIKYKVIKYFD